MSWDIYAMRFPRDAERVEDIPSDFAIEPVGPRAEVLDELMRRFPGSTLDRFGFLGVSVGGIPFDIAIGSEADPIDHLTFNVRGANHAVINAIADVIDHFDLRAVETGSGGWFERATALAGYSHWDEYRRQVVNGPPAEPAPRPRSNRRWVIRHPFWS